MAVIEPVFTPALNGAQTVVAVLLYRMAENHRKRPAETDPQSVFYASCFIAMQMGKRLLKDMVLGSIDELDHRNFQQANELIDAKGEAYFTGAVSDVEMALKQLYGDKPISMQQLSATFRRGDLISRLSALQA